MFRVLCGLYKGLMPKCSVRPTHGDTASLAEEVVEAKVDAAIVTLPLKHPVLHIEEIRHDRPVVWLRREGCGNDSCLCRARHKRNPCRR